MEAVPRMPMVSFELKTSPEQTNFGTLKQYIAEYYQEDPASYTKECYQLEQLRGNAVRPTRDVEGTATIRRYYCQLHSIQNRFLLGGLSESQQMLTFHWKDLYSGATLSKTNLKYEMAVVLHNFAALHTQLGAAESRSDPESMKKACTHFQCAAWAFGYVKDNYALLLQGDLSTELLIYMQALCLAQAQECIMEKSLCDNRKSGIIAKVTAQIISYYNSALAALLTQSGDDGRIQDLVGSKQFKEWRRYVRFKISYLSCILLLYQGQQSEEQQKMGERVALYQASFDKLEEARKESKGLAHIEQVNDALQFTMDVVEAKRKSAKNENEFIYHEEVPELSAISAVQGANLVNGIAFNVTDSEAMGEDIFHRLVPMKAHESSSLYSEEKASLLRTIGTKVEDKDTELETFMSSLNLDAIGQNPTATNDTRLPQGLVDRCAELQAKPNAIPDLVQSMSTLADTCSDVELTLKEIKNLLRQDEKQEEHYQAKIGQRSNGGAHIVELGRELAKYQEAHNKAGESNDTLRKAMGLHVHNLKILSQPLPDIKAQIPVSNEQFDEPTFKELHAILSKVNEMKGQRSKLYQELRHNITEDDITSQLIALESGSNQKAKMDELFRKELSKHDQLVGVLEQNMKAQANILKALTDVYARCAPALKSFTDAKSRRDQFFSSLQASFDVYEDLLSKSAKGLEFYRKLQSNVQKLYSRVKAACDVQEEERNQKLKSSNMSKRASESPSINTLGMDVSGNPTASFASGTGGSSTGRGSGGPKLKDYLKAGTISLGSIKAAGVDKGMTNHLPSVRPTPVGSESTAPMGGGGGSGVGQTGGYYQDSYGSYSNYHQQQQHQLQYGGTNLTNVAPGYDYSQYTPQTPQQTQQHQPQSQPQPTSTGYTNPMYQTNNNNTNNSYYYNQSPQQQPQQQIQQHNPTNNIGGYDYGQYGQTAAPTQQASPAPSTASSSTDAGQTQAAWSQLNQQFGIMNLQQNTGEYYMPASASSSIGNYTVASVSDSSIQSYPSVQGQIPGYQAATGSQQQQQQYPVSSVTGTYSQYPASSSESMGSVSSVQDMSAYGNYPQTQPQHQQQPSQQQQQPPPTQQQQQQAPPTQHYQQGPYQTEQTASYGSHPGYSYNSSTGAYDYASGFQYDSSGAGAVSYQNQYVANPQVGNTSQSTYSASNQTSTSVDSTASQQYQLSTGSYQPAGAGYPSVSGTTPTAVSYAQEQQPNTSYYANHAGAPVNTSTPGYYHQSSTYSTIQSNQYLHQSQGEQTIQPQATPNGNSDQAAHVAHYSHHTNSYVDSTGSQQQQPQYSHQTPATASTTTTASSQQHQSVVSPQVHVPQATTVPQSKNVDLLSGIDFSPAIVPPISVPILQPQPSTSSIAGSLVDGTETNHSVILTPTKANSESLVEKAKEQVMSATPSAATIGDRKPSLDNLSLCSDMSSSFDWESASVCGATATVSGMVTNTLPSNSSLDNVFLRPAKPDPFDDAATVKWFHKEVERLEKFVETINIKTLNGTTPLDSKWKELQDLLVKEESKRQVNVARLFPEKNRSIDCVPYDHARVQLSTDTDNYINAVYVKFKKDQKLDLGFGCPHFILAQTPLPNTVNDFWNMAWSQKSNVIICLHTANELLDPFWPTETGKELSYGDVSVMLEKQFDLTHCTERTLRISMLGSDYSQSVALLQPKLWPKNSPEQVLGVAQNLIDAYRQYNHEQKQQQLRPLVLNCLNGTDRSSLITVAITTILATQTRKPLLINVIDIWYRICCQRKGALRDPNYIQLSYQIVLNNGHSILNKRGILTSYQMKSAQAASNAVQEEANNDPFKDLDPLWKLK
ncbi:tyrosine-protein phosphatase non-receptor type 23 [Anopheles ziemanni]|uniref:tyrosine-protein phosphatase non-receptor type 23 n=1 Tax=Anopheles coustani TaxID=139045 RepID=UPI00265A206E|nr:tyrosine-protein phosphatase non-receptor type 23 [Anopheles coustani]XP_058171797.1 tyrosine-protein phosphatase non-receptor type 23 [Anopheles ziemanni]